MGLSLQSPNYSLHEPETILQVKDFQVLLQDNFHIAFNNYLKTYYGIDEIEFKELIKTVMPEKFI